MSIVSAAVKGVALVGGLGLAADIFAGSQTAKPDATTSIAVPTTSAPAAANTVPPRDGIALASPHASAVDTPSQPNAWGGARTGQESTLSDRVVNYEIEATLDPVKHPIDGKQKLTWRNRSDR